MSPSPFQVAWVALASVALLGATRLGVEAQPEHRTPPGWRFHWPSGDSSKGRQVFIKLECYSCHEVRGESFPAPSAAESLGPELAEMGPRHEPEYFAEAIINPSAVIEPGKWYGAPDGSSKMPSFNDVVTVQEVVDLVAYLVTLKPPTADPLGSGGSGDGGHATH